MTPTEIEQALAQRFPAVAREDDHWDVELDGLQLLVVADDESDRARVMVPVAAVDRPDEETFQRLLEANFASSLDARYAIHNGVLWTVFLSPLSSLSEHMLDQAISQVLELARTTGTWYSASPVALGAGFAQLH